MLKQLLCRLQGRLTDERDQVVNTQICIDRLIESPDTFGSNAPSAGMRIHDHRIAARNHADRVAVNRGQRMGYWRDGSDNTKRCMLDDRQSVVAAVALGFLRNSTPGVVHPTS